MLYAEDVGGPGQAPTTIRLCVKKNKEFPSMLDTIERFKTVYKKVNDPSP
jgi:hypothetical protein